jgi:hypothetical protein
MASSANAQMTGSEMRSPAVISCKVQSTEEKTSRLRAGRFESSKKTTPPLLPKNYESQPIFSYNIDTTKNLSWDSDAKKLHILWMQNATKSVPNDQYPHAAIKRLMRLNPSVFQVCSEVLAPFSMLADMFVGMLLLGSCKSKCNQQAAVITEKDVIHSSIAPNPLLTWAIDVIDVETLLDFPQAEEDITILANVLPELLIRDHPEELKKKLIEAHFKLIAESDEPFGELPQIDHELIPRTAVIKRDPKLDDFSDRICSAQAPDQSAHAVIFPTNLAAPDTSEHDYPVFLRTSENLLSACNTQNQSKHHFSKHASKKFSSDEILDKFAPEFNFNMICRETQSCCLNENAFPMEYVTFFSNIDPMWLSHEADHDVDSVNFFETHDLMKDAEIDRLKNENAQCH